jgi:hypothetical protein
MLGVPRMKHAREESGRTAACAAHSTYQLMLQRRGEAKPAERAPGA